MSLDKKELGEKIKEARKLKSKKINKKYTGQMLADELEISRSYLGDIESGRVYPSYRLLTRIAKACDVPLDFLGDTDASLERRVSEHFPHLNESEKAEFIKHIKSNINSPLGVVDWDLDTWMDSWNDRKNFDISSDAQRKALRDDIEFDSAEDAMTFILKQTVIADFGRFDVSKMTEQEFSDFVNELLNYLQLLGLKYRK
jgi:transcriptional regulator with XRE-family HTH domain